MELIINGTNLRYEIQGLCRQFYPDTDFSAADTTLKLDFDGERSKAEFFVNDCVFRSEVAAMKSFDPERLAVKRSVFNILSEATGIVPPWGLLTGIRPALYFKSLSDRFGKAAEKMFLDDYLVSETKLALCKRVLSARADIAAHAAPTNVSFYISVPFCPTRCSYCSFVSSSTAGEGKYIEPYIDRLCAEISEKGKMLAELEKKVLTVYIGGGTPTVLSAEELRKLLKTVTESIDMSDVSEFTVEAGRPDTITTEKLSIMKSFGVSRVSVNPQTLSDKVLEAIGRKHSVADFFRAYELAAGAGFDINVDLIAGLPADTPESFEKSVLGIIALKPENITLHTLYIKRASDYGQYGGLDFASLVAVTGKMVVRSHDLCEKSGYLPYYLYRQKSTIGNHENVGYALPGKGCAYNIFMMDDIQTVIGAGANAMTKIVCGHGDYQRYANTKFAYNYIAEHGFNTDTIRPALQGVT